MSSEYSEAGGIAGHTHDNISIQNCENYGNIESLVTQSTVGGIIGSHDCEGYAGTGNIVKCANHGNIIGNRFVGGIAGELDFQVEKTKAVKECYNVGDIVSRENYAGGIVGCSLDTDIENCYNSGSVMATDSHKAGGIVGHDGFPDMDLDYKGSIINCYNSGDIITGTSIKAGIMGLKKKSDIQNCYYLDSANVSVGYGDSEMTGVKCTNSDMQKKETFVGFDFNSTWKFIKENKFPVLMWQDGTERDNVPPISGGGGFALPIQVPPQSPEIETMDGVEVTLSEDGTTATISIKDGYLLTEVMVNGVSRGKTLIIQGLKTGDKVKVIVEKEEKNDGKSELLKKIKSVKLTTCSKIVRVKGKQAIKISCYEKEISGIDFDGFEIYRSTKRTKGYGKKPIFVAQKNQYYNTKVKAGVTYYYKARAFVEIDGNKQYTNWSTKSWRKIR